MKLDLLSTSPLVALIIVGVFWSFPGQAQNVSEADYDWLIELRTRQLKGYFNYQGTSLRPIIQVGVWYRRMTASEVIQPQRYEDLFYRGCDPVSARHYRKFGIERGSGVNIHVLTRSPTVSETPCAIANALSRLLLDCYLNQNPIITIHVPLPIFHSVIQGMAHQRFFPAPEESPGTPVYSAIVLYFESDPEGLTQTLHFQGKAMD